MKKTIFSSLIVAWAALDLPTLAGMLIFAAGLAMAAYIWVKWGMDSNNKNCRNNKNDAIPD